VIGVDFAIARIGRLARALTHHARQLDGASRPTGSSIRVYQSQMSTCYADNERIAEPMSTLALSALLYGRPMQARLAINPACSEQLAGRVLQEDDPRIAQPVGQRPHCTPELGARLCRVQG
jgi:hypothetical protein